MFLWLSDQGNAKIPSNYDCNIPIANARCAEIAIVYSKPSSIDGYQKRLPPGIVGFMAYLAAEEFNLRAENPGGEGGIVNLGDWILDRLRFFARR